MQTTDTVSTSKSSAVDSLPYLKVPLEQWSNAQVSEWLHATDLGRFASDLEDMNGIVLNSITSQELDKLTGLTPAAKIAIMKNISYIKKKQQKLKK